MQQARNGCNLVSLRDTRLITLLLQVVAEVVQFNLAVAVAAVC
jgi:hypothetical protein